MLATAWYSRIKYLSQILNEIKKEMTDQFQVSVSVWVWVCVCARAYLFVCRTAAADGYQSYNDTGRNEKAISTTVGPCISF